MEPTSNSNPFNTANNEDSTNDSVVVPPVSSIDTVPAPQITAASYTPTSVATPRNGWLVARAYLPEFLIMLVALASVLSATSSLIATGIDKLPPNNSSSMDVWGALSSYTLLISLASLVVFLPIFVLLYLRTQGTEKQTPDVVTHRWRKGLLGGFIVIEALGVIVSLISLVYTLLSQFIKVGVPLVGSSVSTTPVWKTIVSTLVSVALVTFVIWVVSRHYARVGQGN